MDENINEILVLAGKLANAANIVIESNSFNLSSNIELLNNALLAYNEKVFSISNSK